MRRGRLLLLGAIVASSLVEASHGFGSPAATAISLPTGNVTVARLAIVGTSAKAPALAVATTGRFPTTTFAIGGVGLQAGTTNRFVATVAVFDTTQPGAATPAPGKLTVRVPAGFTVSGTQVLSNVLWANSHTGVTFPKVPAATVLKGTPPPKISILRLLGDAQKLALDQNVQVADMQLAGVQYVSARVARTSKATSYTATISLANLGQLNGIQLTVPKGMTAVGGSGPPQTSVSAGGRNVQLLASQGFFTVATPYRFSFDVSAPLPAGSVLEVRVSTHYFENVLPLVEHVTVA